MHARCIVLRHEEAFVSELGVVLYGSGALERPTPRKMPSAAGWRAFAPVPFWCSAADTVGVQVLVPAERTPGALSRREGNLKGDRRRTCRTLTRRERRFWCAGDHIR